MDNQPVVVVHTEQPAAPVMYPELHQQQMMQQAQPVVVVQQPQVVQPQQVVVTTVVSNAPQVSKHSAKYSQGLCDLCSEGTGYCNSLQFLLKF
jgi:hypothetical protein